MQPHRGFGGIAGNDHQEKKYAHEPYGLRKFLLSDGRQKRGVVLRELYLLESMCVFTLNVLKNANKAVTCPIARECINCEGFVGLNEL